MRQKMYIAMCYGVKNGEPRNFFNHIFPTLDESEARLKIKVWFEKDCKYLTEKLHVKNLNAKNHCLWYDAKITFDDSDDFIAYDIIERETETIID